MGSVRFGLPEELVLSLAKLHGIDHFVETGTFQGDTAFWAAWHFKRVTTIELPGEWFETARAKLRDFPHVTLLCGDSRKLLGEVVAALPGPAIFWLDAHWMGVGPTPEVECPVLTEIAHINASRYDNIILCDDARYFQNPPPPPHDPKQWPNMGHMTIALENTYHRRTVKVIDDVVISLPHENHL